MANTGSLVQTLNNISLDDEEGGIKFGEETSGLDISQNQGFDANLCVIRRFIIGGEWSLKL